MADPYLGQITMFAGSYAPRNWACCSGQLLTIANNEALYSLLGTIYGGDGHATFALPDLRGRVPVHQGAGPGMRPWPLGAMAGAELERLSPAQIPSHRHPMQATSSPDDAIDPEGRMLGVDADESYTGSATELRSLHAAAVSPVGGEQPHGNMAPYLGINFIIALVGVYPQRQ